MQSDRSVQNTGPVNSEADGFAGLYSDATGVNNVYASLMGAAINVAHRDCAGSRLADGLAVEGYFVFVAVSKALSAGDLKGNVAVSTVEGLLVLGCDKAQTGIHCAFCLNFLTQLFRLTNGFRFGQCHGGNWLDFDRLRRALIRRFVGIGHIDDLPPELMQQAEAPATGQTWQGGLRNWAEQELKRGRKSILDTAVPEFERIMIETALKHTGGRRRDASILLGWGRNTLTRKINELDMDHPETEED